MAIQLQLRRGTTAENDVFVGGAGELTMDTDTNGLRIHDGNTTGGFDVPVLVAVQRPTADNNYTWYRKYSDGWIEQGGVKKASSTVYLDVQLPIAMSDENYIINTTSLSSVTDGIRAGHVLTSSKTTTGFRFGYINGATAVTTNFTWEVKGMAAS